MSAELLRRAAAALRKHAEEASPGPWSAGDLIDGVFYTSYGDFGWVLRGPAGSPEFEDSEQGKADVRFAALVGPPVALALADLLDAEAGALEAAPEVMVSTGLWDHHVAVARAVLREEL